MSIPLFAFPYKVRPTPTRWTAGWKGWRLKTLLLFINEPCACVGAEHHGEACECFDRGPHLHTSIGWESRAIFNPSAKRAAS